MTTKLWLAAFLCYLSLLGTAQIKVEEQRTENRTNPIGISSGQPSFSWQLQSPQRGVLQTAYELIVREKSDKEGVVWHTGKINSEQSVWVKYAGPALASGKGYSWTVRVWDNHGKVSAWSQPASFQTGFLHSSDWKARWIVPGFKEDSAHSPCPVFGKEFMVSKPVASATVYVTAHGLYEATLNSKKVGSDFFTPGFTSYHKRLQYQVYDVAQDIQQGQNTISVTVGDGWWRGEFGADMKNNRYGSEAGLLFQLELSYRDGSHETIISDGSWKSSIGPIAYSSIYNGEIFDQRDRLRAWSGVREEDISLDNLVAGTDEPVRQHEHFSPVRILKTPRGETVLDFGQNLAGWVRVTVEGRAGDTLRLSHGESLDAEGNFYTGNLRFASAQDIYILKGGKTILEPHFTYHGFRYVKVEGYPGALDPASFTAIALYSDLAETGRFTCSDSLINRLQSNITWSQKSNFVDIPTDCPQRSERFGWTGDAQVFCRTASFNQDVKGFFTKWLADLAADQGSNGGLPVITPYFLNPDAAGPRGGVAGWGDAATIIPWQLFEVYGDTAILERQYGSMKAWVDYIRSVSDTSGGLWKANGYGDWYAPLGSTDLPYIDECFYIHSISLLANTAQVLGKAEDLDTYTRLLKRIKAVFRQAYLTDARLPHTQTAYVLALEFDLLPDSLRPGAAQQLASLIHANHDHLATGFLGTPYLLAVLSRYGYTDLAFTLLNQNTAPSWLYPLSRGATTIWEKWEAVKPAGGFDTCSLNHYAYGAVGDWLYREVAGIDAAAPGYKKILIHPHIGGGLTRAAAEYKTMYGLVRSAWEIKGQELIMEVTIPAGTSALIRIPSENIEGILEGSKPLSKADGILSTGRTSGSVELTVGSGTYHFRAFPTHQLF